MGKPQETGVLAADPVSLLHISDTHGMHRYIESRFPMPSADILVHTGDWSDQGTIEESAEFNTWLGEIKHRYRYIVVIAGNHEWRLLRKCGADHPLAEAASDPKGFFSGLLTHATHVLDHEGATLCGINIYGSAWVPSAQAANPDKPDGRVPAVAAKVSRFDEVPRGTDVLLTHGPPAMIFDQMEGSKARWGSSKILAASVQAAAPAAHLFGHLHEQRGVWHRPSTSAAWMGGCEYERVPGEHWPTWAPPSVQHPCTLISCNAMANHPALEGTHASHIAGPARLIVATPRTSENGAVLRKQADACWAGANNAEWRFEVCEATANAPPLRAPGPAA